MVTKRRWTKEEEEILVQAIKANPHNISEACRNVSVKLKRSEKACFSHWYTVLAPSINPTKIGVSFIAIGENTTYKNRKNSGTALTKPKKDNLWNKIKKFIGIK